MEVNFKGFFTFEGGRMDFQVKRVKQVIGVTMYYARIVFCETNDNGVCVIGGVY